MYVISLSTQKRRNESLTTAKKDIIEAQWYMLSRCVMDYSTSISHARGRQHAGMSIWNICNAIDVECADVESGSRWPTNGPV